MTRTAKTPGKQRGRPTHAAHLDFGPDAVLPDSLLWNGSKPVLLRKWVTGHRPGSYERICMASVAASRLAGCLWLKERRAQK